MKNAVFGKLILVFCFLVAFALSIKSLREPDLWWQIRTGEWILENGKVPVQDVFSYTMPGAEWINIKWGFELMAAIISGISGPESIFILQGIVSLLIVFFLYRLSKSFYRNDFDVSAFTIALIITLIGIEYRIIGRPEMFSHLFVCIFLYLLFTFRAGSNRIFFLVPLQAIWANVHEAFGTGLIMIFIFVFSHWWKFLMSRKNSKLPVREPLTLSLVFFLSVISVLLNPYHVKLLLRPLNILSQVYENKFTTELFSFTNPLYWQKEAYIGLFVLAGILHVVYYEFKARKKQKQKTLISSTELGYLITVAAFFYLALTAYRNIVFFILLSFPVLYGATTDVFFRLQKKIKVFAKLKRVVAILCIIVFYVAIITNQYYTVTDSRNRFGLEVLSNNNPVDAAEWIDKNGLKNKKCFSDYLTSSCLLWKLQPEFKTYIDLRDLDVFPPEFFQKFLTVVNYPDAFFREDSVSKFEYVVLFRPQFKALHSYLYNDSIYACKYVDAVAAVYEKTDSFSREDIFSECKPVHASGFSKAVNHILNPFYKPFDYSTDNVNYIAASYYIDVFRFDLATKRAEKIINGTREKDRGFELLGIINYELASRQKDAREVAKFFEQSKSYYLESLRLNRNNMNAAMGLGQIFFMNQDYKSALTRFENIIETEPENYNAYVMAAESSRMLHRKSRGKNEELIGKTLEYFIRAEKLNPGNPYILFNIGLTYYSMNNCSKASDFFNRIKDDLYLGEENRNVAKRYLKECEGK